MDKKLKKALNAADEQKKKLRSFGDVFPDTNVYVRPEGKKDIEVPLKTPNLITASLMREELKSVFGIDVRNDVFGDMVNLQNESGLNANDESEQFELNTKVINMLLEDYVVGNILKKAIFEGLGQEEVDGKTVITINEDTDAYKSLEKILNLFLDYPKNLRINDDEIPESSITEVMVLALMYLSTPS